MLMSDGCRRHSKYWMHTRSLHTRLKQVDKYLSFTYHIFFLGGRPMSIPSLRSIPRFKMDLHSFMNTILVKHMVKISLDGVQMILSMQHGGTSLLKVCTRFFLVA